mmetsp:Transcript_16801/g.25399  ORF Transcript_16801/g.25399 Transcript_16801/m.25399 type:complete len:88 (+) Transcript_16801:170-433(+)
MSTANQEENTPNPVHDGSATRPSDKQFGGRGGRWRCENCGKITGPLRPGTKQWDCKACGMKMYTLPEDDCPVDTFCPCCCWDALLTR